MTADEPAWTIPACEPTDDPAWWRMLDPCDDGCHHPLHAFRPERRRHLIEADLAVAATARGWIEPRPAPTETTP